MLRPHLHRLSELHLYCGGSFELDFTFAILKSARSMPRLCFLNIRNGNATTGPINTALSRQSPPYAEIFDIDLQRLPDIHLPAPLLTHVVLERVVFFDDIRLPPTLLSLEIYHCWSSEQRVKLSTLARVFEPLRTLRSLTIFMGSVDELSHEDVPNNSAQWLPNLSSLKIGASPRLLSIFLQHMNNSTSLKTLRIGINITTPETDSTHLKHPSFPNLSDVTLWSPSSRCFSFVAALNTPSLRTIEIRDLKNHPLQVPKE